MKKTHYWTLAPRHVSPRPRSSIACMMRRFTSGVSIAVAVLVGPSSNPSQAAVMFDVTIVDAGDDFLSLHNPIREHALAAGERWATHFLPLGNPTIEVVVDLDNPVGPTGNGASVVASPVATRNGFFVSEEGAVAEIRTDTDPNGVNPDVRFTFGSTYLTNELWFDPNPTERTAAVPGNMTDAFSVFLHEYGHAFGFNGFMDGTDGTFPLGPFKSTFDELVTFDGSDFSFIGQGAMALYGGPVPVTFGNPFHLGNTTGPGTDLLPDLMNGAVFDRGIRYDISTLDLAILNDIGVPIASQVAKVPEPSSLVIFLIALAGLGFVLRHHEPAARKPKYP